MAENIIQIIIRAKDEATAELKKLDGSLKGLGLTAAAFTGVAAGTVAALAKFAEEGGAEANELRVLGLQSGQTAEQMSRLKFVADQNELSIEGLASGLKIMNRNLYDAKLGGGQANNALHTLGFTTAELKAGLGNAHEAFLKIIERMQGVSDAGTRTALTLKIFGRGAIDMAQLIGIPIEQLKEMEAQADATGASVSNQAAVIGAAFHDATQKVKDQIEGLKAKIATVLLPSMTQAVEGVSKLLTVFNKFAAAHPAIVGAIFATAAAVTGLGVAFGGVLLLAPLVSAGLATMGLSVTALAAAGGPIALAVLAIGALTYAVIRLRGEAAKPFQVNVVSNAAEAEAELERLAAKRGEEVRKLAEANAQIARLGNVGEIAAGEPLTPKQDALLRAKQDADAAEKAIAKYGVAIAAAGEQLTKLSPKAAAAGDGITAAGDAAQLTTAELIDAALKAGNLQKALDLVHFEGLPKLADLLADFDKEASTPVLFKIVADKEGALHSVRATLDEVKKFLAGDPLALPLTKVKTTEEPGRFKVPGIDSTALQQIPLLFDAATVRAIKLDERLKAMGVDTTALTDAMVKAGIAGGQFAEQIGAGMQIAAAQIRDAFDTTNVVAQSFMQTAADLVNTIVAQFTTIGQRVAAGVNPAIAVITGLFKTVEALIKTLLKDIAELILKLVAIKIVKTLFSGLFLSGGGEVGDDSHYAREGGTAVRSVASSAAAFRSGGQLARLATGGAIAAGLALSALPHYDAGAFRSIPGSPQAHDSVLAMLAPGEAVLPTVGGQNPGNVVARLASLEARLSAASRAPAPAQGPIVGAVHIHAFDSDSVREQTRRGALDRQLARSLDLGRGPG